MTDTHGPHRIEYDTPCADLLNTIIGLYDRRSSRGNYGFWGYHRNPCCSSRTVFIVVLTRLFRALSIRCPVFDISQAICAHIVSKEKVAAALDQGVNKLMAFFNPDNSDNSSLEQMYYIYSVFNCSRGKGDKLQWAYWVGELKGAINLFTP